MIGLPPISTSGFGIDWVCSCSRVPRPPQRIATCICGRLPGMEPDERAARADAYESVRSEIVDLVPAEVRRVLDLGCSTGGARRALKARGEVEGVGIEREPADAEGARAALRPRRGGRRRAPCPRRSGASTASSPPPCSAARGRVGGGTARRGEARARLAVSHVVAERAPGTIESRQLVRADLAAPARRAISDAPHRRRFTLLVAIALLPGRRPRAAAHVDRRPVAVLARHSPGPPRRAAGMRPSPPVTIRVTAPPTPQLRARRRS